MGNNHKKQYKFISWIGGPVFMLLYAIGASVLFYLIIFKPSEEPLTVAILVTTIVMFGVLPWILFVYMAQLFWTRIEISEKGIQRSFLKIFKKREIAWDELLEIRAIHVPTGGYWIFFSKTSLANMSIGKARSQKQQIQIAYSKKLQETIGQFTNLEIINLPQSQEHKGME